MNSIKNFLRPLILLTLPVLFYACEGEEPEPDPQAMECMEISQTDNEGYSFNKIYDGERLVEQQFLLNGDLLNYYTFTYDNDGRISESQYVNAKNDTLIYAPTQITYNSNGNWVEQREDYSTLDFVAEAEYDNQGQIKQYTMKTETDSSNTVHYTITYDWMNGNNTMRTYTSSRYRNVTQFEYDLEQENKRRPAFEQTSFLTTAVNHNKNMRKRTVHSNTDLESGITTESIVDYEYEYNEAGYPTMVTVTTTTGTAEPKVSTTVFEYSCN